MRACVSPTSTESKKMRRLGLRISTGYSNGHQAEVLYLFCRSGARPCKRRSWSGVRERPEQGDQQSTINCLDISLSIRTHLRDDKTCLKVSPPWFTKGEGAKKRERPLDQSVRSRLEGKRALEIVFVTGQREEITSTPSCQVSQGPRETMPEGKELPVRLLPFSLEHKSTLGVDLTNRVLLTNNIVTR